MILNVEHLQCALHSFVVIYDTDCNYFLIHMAYHHGQIFLTSQADNCTQELENVDNICNEYINDQMCLLLDHLMILNFLQHCMNTVYSIWFFGVLETRLGHQFFKPGNRNTRIQTQRNQVCPPLAMPGEGCAISPTLTQVLYG